ncbi:MAG: hypothetical protein R3B99_29965, partial [Polyangiales bacterium]
DAARIAPTLKNDAEAWKVARAAHAFRAKLLEPARAARSANTDPKPPANPTKTSPPAMQESA